MSKEEGKLDEKGELGEWNGFGDEPKKDLKKEEETVMCMMRWGSKSRQRNALERGKER